MKICKAIFGLAFAGLALTSVGASADTQINCSWEYTHTITAYPYGSVSTLKNYACVDAQRGTVANKVVGVTGYLTGTCSVSVTDSNKYYYTGTCQAPVLWEKAVAPKTCSVAGATFTRPVNSDLNYQMGFLCHTDIEPGCGYKVLSSNQSNVTFQCIVKP